MPPHARAASEPQLSNATCGHATRTRAAHRLAAMPTQTLGNVSISRPRPTSRPAASTRPQRSKCRENPPQQPPDSRQATAATVLDATLASKLSKNASPSRRKPKSTALFRACQRGCRRFFSRTACQPPPPATARHFPMARTSWRRAGSNRQPPACKADALPIELRPRETRPHLYFLESTVRLPSPSIRQTCVRAPRVELGTSALSGLRSNQLSYARRLKPAPIPLVAASRPAVRSLGPQVSYSMHKAPLVKPAVNRSHHLSPSTQPHASK